MPESGAQGTIIAQGGGFGGWTLYVKDGVLTFCYNLLGFHRYKAVGSDPLPAGVRQVRAEFAYDGGGLGKGGDVSLYVDGKAAGQGRVDGTQQFIFSYDETTDVGCESGTPVSDDYDLSEANFTGAVNWVRLEAGLDSHDHLIDPAEVFQVAMARQ